VAASDQKLRGISNKSGLKLLYSSTGSTKDESHLRAEEGSLIRFFIFVLATCLAGITFIGSAEAGKGAVKSASTDGEATVYIVGDFKKSFDLKYRAMLQPGKTNRSWTALSILLIGSHIPGPGVSVGLFSVDRRSTVRPFSFVTYPDLSSFSVKPNKKCSAGCVIELRGDTSRIYAYAAGNEVASWSRSDLNLQAPYIQFNAETHAVGDSLVAALDPITETVNARHVEGPSCAFTTRGIKPTGRTQFKFSGTMNNSEGDFVNLSSGRRNDKC
jgi:hypothetical protein